MDTSLPLFQIDGTERTVRVPREFATSFGGLTLVEEAVVEAPKSRAKTAPKKTNSSKEGN